MIDPWCRFTQWRPNVDSASRQRWSTAGDVRAGFSAIELLTVISVISVLLGLIMPAVLAARAQARQTTCLNNLRQIGVALEAFESAHHRYPPATISAVNNSGQKVSDNKSPHVALLPYLDQQPLFQEFDASEPGYGIDDDPPTSQVNAELLGVSVAVYECPDDPSGSPRNNYRISGGTTPCMHQAKIPGNPTASALSGFRTLLGRFDAEFKDGKSHTTAFAERVTGDRDPETFTAWRDVLSLTADPFPMGLKLPDEALQACSGPIDPQPKHYSFGGSTWVLSGYPQTWYNHVLTPNSNIPDCVDGSPMGHGAFTARSMHTGGANVLFADGATRSVSENIDLRVWRSLGSVNGGEAVGDF